MAVERNKEKEDKVSAAHREERSKGIDILDKEHRKNLERIHKGEAGEIDDNEIENTEQKGFDKSGEV
ncbi:MAG TPA: hypothetical protein VIK89_02455 [Cytophagaceae bacterium]